MGMHGKRHSNETREKMRQAQLEREVSDEAQQQKKERLIAARRLQAERPRIPTLAEVRMQTEEKKKKLPDDREGVCIHFTIMARVNEQADGTADIEEIGGHLHLNLNPDGKTLREVFIRWGKPGSREAIVDEWAKQASMRLQEGVSVEDVFRPHIGTRFEPYGGVRGVGNVMNCTSVLDLIAKIVIKRFGTEAAK